MTHDLAGRAGLLEIPSWRGPMTARPNAPSAANISTGFPACAPTLSATGCWKSAIARAHCGACHVDTVAAVGGTRRWASTNMASRSCATERRHVARR